MEDRPVTRRLAAFVLVGALAVGCGGSVLTPVPTGPLPGSNASTPVATDGPGAPAAPATASQGATSTAQPSPSATPDLVYLAKRAYARAAIEHNKAGLHLWRSTACKGSRWSDHTLKQWKSCYAKAAKIDRTFADALRAITWPSEAAADARLLIRAVAKEESIELAASRARSLAALIREEGRLVKAGDSGQELANSVRGYLGLQSIGG
jgi:hypothetical protein